MKNESLKIKGHIRAVYKMGGSLAITIPQHFAKNNLITAGTKLTLIEYDKQLVIQVMSKENLAELLEGQGVLPMIQEGRKLRIQSTEAKNKMSQKLYKGKVKW